VQANAITYVGLRGPQPGYGHGGPNVVGVIRDGRRTTLTLDDERFLSGDFEWGYRGVGPSLLAQAILNDFLGISVDLGVARNFMEDVVAHLPSEFELSGDRVAHWIDARLAWSLADPGLTPSL
jgi:Family of unknown function (DUF6166)